MNELLNLPEMLLQRLLGLRKILTPSFFSLSESIWEIVSTICLLLFLLSVLILGSFISFRIDSIRMFFGTVAVGAGLLMLHAINRRIFQSLDRFVHFNNLIVTDLNMTDAFGALALVAAISTMPVGIYAFLDSGEPLALYVGAMLALSLTYVATYLLNPTILNISTSNEASIGDNGVTYLSILNGIGPARLMRLAYGIAMLNGLLMFSHGVLEKLITSSLDYTTSMYNSPSLGLVGAGALVIACAAISPFPLFLYIIIIHAFIDALSSLVRVKNLGSPERRSEMARETRETTTS